MKRRDLVILLTGSALGWPLAARAQQAEKVPRIGYLFTGSLGLTIPPAFLARADEVIE